MYTVSFYESPVGRLTLVASNDALTGIWIEGQKYFGGNIKDSLSVAADTTHPILHKTEEWLNRYFAGEQPSSLELKLAPLGSDFRKEVWKILCEIPYGQTATYSEIARKIARRRGIDTMSAQAVGGAVGHNPISIIIPCHRVIGSDGNLTGYAGGLDKKIWLLEHEHIL